MESLSFVVFTFKFLSVQLDTAEKRKKTSANKWKINVIDNSIQKYFGQRKKYIMAKYLGSHVYDKAAFFLPGYYQPM